jgi:DegV family protein with EDD domain
MRRVKIVTDSAADIPDDLVQELEIGVIYDYVNFGEESLQDKIGISRDKFYARLIADRVVPTTSTPSTGEFMQLYRDVGAPDADVISLHPPSGLSGLCNAARLAAQEFPEGRVTVVDTEQLSMGMGWQVIAAARMAQAGAPVAEILAHLAELRPRVHVFAALDTVEYLRRSGRVSWAQAIVSTLLNIKPMIEVRGGQVLPLERVRTKRRSLSRLVELTRNLGKLESLAVLYTHRPDGTDELRQRLAQQCTGDQVLTVNVTPIIGVHTGPNGLGVAVVVAA